MVHHMNTYSALMFCHTELVNDRFKTSGAQLPIASNLLYEYNLVRFFV